MTSSKKRKLLRPSFETKDDSVFRPQPPTTAPPPPIFTPAAKPSVSSTALPPPPPIFTPAAKPSASSTAMPPPISTPAAKPSASATALPPPPPNSTLTAKPSASSTALPLPPPITTAAVQVVHRIEENVRTVSIEVSCPCGRKYFHEEK
ncbi:extensin-like [Lycium barbarum]|uniref:extensin-like n=1 Tax=Lycium barbarum TaxID=112863 RepID=UPI00293EFCBB|nr:extensin-like [Lycium barbarum]